MVKIRLMRLGRKNKPFYRIVVMESSRARNAKAIDFLGHYDPTTNPKTMELDMDKYADWIAKGAQPTDTVKFIAQKTAA